MYHKYSFIFVVFYCGKNPQMQKLEITIITWCIKNIPRNKKNWLYRVWCTNIFARNKTNTIVSYKFVLLCTDITSILAHDVKESWWTSTDLEYFFHFYTKNKRIFKLHCILHSYVVPTLEISKPKSVMQLKKYTELFCFKLRFVFLQNYGQKSSNCIQFMKSTTWF